MSQKQKCATCSVACRGNQCKTCYTNSRRGHQSVTDDTILFSELFPSQADVRNENFSNAAFANGTASNFADTPDAPPASVEDLYNLFVGMRSDFVNMIKEKDATIASLTARVASLEKIVKKNETIKTPDMKMLTEIKEEYSSNMKTIKATVAAQQKTLEDLQHDKRAKNLVITGEHEPSGTSQDERADDGSAVEGILAAIRCSEVKPSQIKRLGAKRDQQPQPNGVARNTQAASPPPRPILVTLNSTADVRLVLSKAHTLKNDATFSSVYVKKDEHPLVRKEWNRLREVARKEKSAPINVRCTIKLDYKKKAVTRDGEVIDEFVSPFQHQDPNASA